MLFRYLAARWRYRHSPAKRYIRPGLALEQRGRELAVFWSDHFSRSRASQARWAKECSGDVLTVLGAGALRDFNGNALSRRFKILRLVDANPLSLEYWGSLNCPVEPVITDITGCLTEWSRALNKFKGSWPQTLEFIRNLGTPAKGYSLPSSALLSLNILSQLEVGWQEIVEPSLKRRFGRAFVQQREEVWLDAIRPGSRTLAEQHLAAIESSGAQWVLLISDVECVEYTGRVYTKKRNEEPPVRWSADGWHADPGIRCEITPALDGVELNAATFHQWMPSYQLNWQDTWLWHIAPNGTETASYGTVHRVAAFSLRRHGKAVSV